MEINQNFKFVEGKFNTEKDKMVCVPNRKYMEVQLCLKPDDCGWNIPVAKIKLHSGNTYGDASWVFDDMAKLGKEIARRWNECQTKE